MSDGHNINQATIPSLLKGLDALETADAAIALESHGAVNLKNISQAPPEITLAHQTAHLMERLADNLIEGAEYVDGWHRVVRLIEYALAVGAGVTTLIDFFDKDMGAGFDIAAKSIDIAAVCGMLLTQAYFASLGERRPEIFRVFADALKYHVTEIRIALTEDYDSTTRAVLRQQLRAALHEVDRVRGQFPFAVKMLTVQDGNERKKILRRLLLPDGRR